MYLLAWFGDHMSYRSVDMYSYITSYMDNLEKAKLTASIRKIVIFLKPGIPIFNAKVPDKAGKKTRRRTQAIVNRYTYHTNAKSTYQMLLMLPFYSLRRTKKYCQKWRILNHLFDKNLAQDNGKCRILDSTVGLDKL